MFREHAQFLLNLSMSRRFGRFIFFAGGGVLIFERIENWGGGFRGGDFFGKLSVELFGWEGDFLDCIHPYVKG